MFFIVIVVVIVIVVIVVIVIVTRIVLASCSARSSSWVGAPSLVVDKPKSIQFSQRCPVLPVKVFECANGFLEDDLGEGCLGDVGNIQNIEKSRYI